jgi:hypothetical protein
MPIPGDNARENIDRLLSNTGWTVYNNPRDANLVAYRGLAIRNFTLKPGRGFAYYLPKLG